MNSKQVKQIIDKIKNVKIAVYGDFCLDAYWILSPQGGEISVETELQAQAVKKHYYTLGGASNIVANLAALKPAHIRSIGVIGEDIFGRELLSQLHNLQIDTSALVVQKDDFYTVNFGKRYLLGQEQTRIDFGFFNKRSDKTDETLIKNIEQALKDCDVLIFNQQVPGSITNEKFIDQVNSLFQKYDDKIILLDSRHYGNKFKNVWRKTNDVEASISSGTQINSGDVISLEKSKHFASELYNDSKKPVFLTRGSKGIIVVDSEGTHEIPGIQILKKIDSVGAGDTIMSALGLCLGAGLRAVEAAKFANFAAAVTVQKIFQTGTASEYEIIDISNDPDYVYHPELAEDVRYAKYIEDTDIELCFRDNVLNINNIKHAVFDHDGTISTLREGWEQIMEPVMVKAVLGDQYDTVDEILFRKVRDRVTDFIDKTTGIQTIVQMDGLVDIVKEFGIVQYDKILDKFGYKEIYNDALLQMVAQRVNKIYNGQLDVNDYIIKGAVDFLYALKKKGIKLYLASGTDYNDVLKEAEILGYADLFNGEIYGAVDDINKYSKKKLIENIINKNNLYGSELAVFGDGPVEIRECRKRGGISIGIASDEIHRHGLNEQKRTRLIKAGAHIIIPDYSQFESLLNVLFCNT